MTTTITDGSADELSLARGGMSMTYRVFARTFTDADEMLAFAAREVRQEGADRVALIFDGATDDDDLEEIGRAHGYLKGDGTLGSEAVLFGDRYGRGERRATT